MAVEKDATLGKHKTLSTFPPPRRRSLNNVLPGSAEARRRRKNSPTACRKTWWRKCVPSDRGIYKDRRVRIIIECPEKRFSTQRPDTFTRTTLSPNFKPLAVRRRTIHFRQLSQRVPLLPLALRLQNCALLNRPRFMQSSIITASISTHRAGLPARGIRLAS